MSNLDKFNLGTAIIGLVADMIGISVFVASLQLGAVNSTSPDLPQIAKTAIFIISAFLILYGWLILSWLIIKRFMARASAPDFADIAYRTVLGLGAVISPLIYLWWSSLAMIMQPAAAVNQSQTLQGMPLLYAFTTFLVAGSFMMLITVALMPVIYSNIPVIPIDAAFRKPFTLFESLLKMSIRAKDQILHNKD